jgi:hypothetical protein
LLGRKDFCHTLHGLAWFQKQIQLVSTLRASQADRAGPDDLAAPLAFVQPAYTTIYLRPMACCDLRLSKIGLVIKNNKIVICLEGHFGKKVRGYQVCVGVFLLLVMFGTTYFITF